VEERNRKFFSSCADSGQDSADTDTDHRDSQAAAIAQKQQPSSAAVQSEPVTGDYKCFKDEEGDEGFKFSGIPIPSRGRPSSENLASRLAILR